MSTHLTGFISDDNDLYKKHSAVLKACLAAGIKELPTETAEYFECKYPEEYALEEKLRIKIPYKEYSADMSEGFEIIVSEIPQGVYKIRFTNSY